MKRYLRIEDLNYTLISRNDKLPMHNKTKQTNNNP